MTEIVVTLAIGALLVLAGLWLLQRRLIYFPALEVLPLSAPLPGARIIQISTDDGLTLTGWFLAPPTPTAAVLVLNRNAGNRADRAPLAKALVDRLRAGSSLSPSGYSDHRCLTLRGMQAPTVNFESEHRGPRFVPERARWSSPPFLAPHHRDKSRQFLASRP